jgi:hypothetical protein
MKDVEFFVIYTGTGTGEMVEIGTEGGAGAVIFDKPEP